nr:MoaD/ThiS family protein [Micromonospora sp. DSM 115978]
MSATVATNTETGVQCALLFVDLDGKFPGLRGRLISGDGEGELHRFVNVYVNDEDVRFLGGLDAKIADGDSVTILPAVAGGSADVPAGGSVEVPATTSCCFEPTAAADARLS